MNSLNQNINIDEFQKAYDTLNPEQKTAVDKVYGPVMVVAGPGTGKTQLLAVRVCNILKQTDLQASNILCLTYTDAGCTAMRNRLITFMGTDAYKVGIYTYHAFCNLIIRENPELFNAYRELSNASDLEIMEVLTELIDGLPLEHPLARNAGDNYYDRPRFKTLFSVMKREGWSHDHIADKIEQYKEELYQDVDYIYKRGEKKGAPMEDKIQKELSKYDFVKEGSKLLGQYNELLAKRDRLDFDDSIIWVLKKLKERPDVLAQYQERFQFILADEYQDTNGSQNELLFTLAKNEFDPQPNLFVVGDDDQSIYRFQGANMDNIVLFMKEFEPDVIVLQNNYRSHQAILDKATLLINNNRERLTHKYPDLVKQLKESRKSNQGGSPVFLPYANMANQQCGVTKLVKDLSSKGVKYNEIAIIYRKHKEAENLLKYFSLEGIPVSIKKKINILKLNEIKRILTLLRYIDQEYREVNSQNAQLFEILHYDFWGLSAKDIGKIALLASANTDESSDDLIWRDVISDESKLQKFGILHAELFIHTSQILEGLINDYKNVTPQVLFEKLLTNTGMLNHFLASPDKIWMLQVVNTLFEFIKSETSKTEGLGIDEILSILDKMEEMGIDMSINYLKTNNEGINFLTAHGSKGLEFDHVIIINADEKTWIDDRGARVKFPPNMLFGAGDATEEDDRRLFYVSLTRARNNAYITFSHLSETEKEQQASRFITEMEYNVLIPPITNTDEDLINFSSTLMKYDQGQVSLIEHELIDRVLENMQMNATGITKYLNCPRTFYFENILRVPMARTKNLGFGNAIHYAMEMFYRNMVASPSLEIGSLESLQELFKKGMRKFHAHFTKLEAERALYTGLNILTFYYNNTIQSWTKPRTLKAELNIKGHIKDIPVSGILDRVDVYDDHMTIVDYKTGNRNGESEKFKKGEDLTNGGDYWRQGVFYQLLIKLEPNLQSKLQTVIFELLEQYEPDKAKVRRVEVDGTDQDLVIAQLEYVYEKIKNHEFDEGCNDERCKWCAFVNSHMTKPLIPSDSVEETDSEMMYGE